MSASAAFALGTFIGAIVYPWVAEAVTDFALFIWELPPQRKTP